MARIPVVILCAFGSLVFAGAMSPQAARADTPPSVLRIGQRATAVIWHAHETFDVATPTGMSAWVESRGTAFCITKSGYFVTDAHVIGEEDEIRLAIETTPHHVEYYDAHAIKRDTNLDLALLKIDFGEGLVPVDITTPVTVTRGMHVTAFGYPVHGKEFYDPKIFYSASVHGGSVTALYGKGHTLTDVQTSTGLGPGASGGPVLNDRGQLVGIIQKGRRGTSANLAKSAHALTTFLADPKIAADIRKPELQFFPPGGFGAADIFTHDCNFKPKVLAGLDPVHSAQATLTLEVFGRPTRVFHCAIGPDGFCEFPVRLLLPLPEQPTVTLTMLGSDPAHLTSCQVQDSPVTVGTRTVHLSEVSRIEQGTEPVVLLRSGERLPGKASGLEALHTVTNGQTVPTNLQGAKRIAVRDDLELPRSVECHLEITQANKTVLEHYWGVALEGLPPRRMGQPMLIACGTAWATNDTGSDKGHASDLSPSTVQYIHNITNLLTNGVKSNLLIYSNHWTFGKPFQEVLRSEGHTVRVTTEPGPLDAYDAVFVGGSGGDINALHRYVEHGGKVYVSGGLDANGRELNDLLNRVGLYTQKEARAAALPDNSLPYAPLFEGVQELKVKGTMHMGRREGASRETQVITSAAGADLWAMYRGGEKLSPEPPPVVVQQPKLPPRQRPDSFLNRVPLMVREIHVDFVGATTPSTEPGHHLLENKSTTGISVARVSRLGWRAAEDGGWFSYEVNVMSRSKNVLTLTFLRDEAESRGLEVTIEGVKQAEPNPSSQKTPLYRLDYPLSPEFVGDKTHVVVRVQAQPGKTTGRLIGISVVGSSGPTKPTP